MMTKEQAKDAYRRTADWERAATRRLLDELRARGASDPVGATLHNWGTCAGREPYATLAREYHWRQRAIWDTSHRLRDSFAFYFCTLARPFAHDHV